MGASVGAAFTNLVAALQAEATLNGVQVLFGPPEAYEEQEVVAVLGLGQDNEDTAGLDLASEDYVINVRVKVDKPDASDAGEVSTRAWALVDGIRAAIEADELLGGAVMKAKVTGAASAGPLPALDEPNGNQQGWAQYVDVRVTCLGLF
jgi:hypothetical protein